MEAWIAQGYPVEQLVADTLSDTLDTAQEVNPLKS